MKPRPFFRRIPAGRVRKLIASGREGGAKFANRNGHYSNLCVMKAALHLPNEDS